MRRARRDAIVRAHNARRECLCVGVGGGASRCVVRDCALCVCFVVVVVAAWRVETRGTRGEGGGRRRRQGGRRLPRGRLLGGGRQPALVSVPLTSPCCRHLSTGWRKRVCCVCVGGGRHHQFCDPRVQAVVALHPRTCACGHTRVCAQWWLARGSAALALVGDGAPRVVWPPPQ